MSATEQAQRAVAIYTILIALVIVIVLVAGRCRKSTTGTEDERSEP